MCIKLYQVLGLQTLGFYLFRSRRHTSRNNSFDKFERNQYCLWCKCLIYGRKKHWRAINTSYPLCWGQSCLWRFEHTIIKKIDPSIFFRFRLFQETTQCTTLISGFVSFEHVWFDKFLECYTSVDPTSCDFPKRYTVRGGKGEEKKQELFNWTRIGT